MYKLNYSINTKYKNTETEQHLMNYLPSSIIDALDINHKGDLVELVMSVKGFKVSNEFPSDLDLAFQIYRNNASGNYLKNITESAINA
jgi:hypothetical protein